MSQLSWIQKFLIKNIQNLSGTKKKINNYMVKFLFMAINTNNKSNQLLPKIGIHKITMIMAIKTRNKVNPKLQKLSVLEINQPFSNN